MAKARRLQLQGHTHIERSTGAANYLFTTFGTLNDLTDDCYVIETNIRVTGMTTGYRTSIPVQIVKAASAF